MLSEPKALPFPLEPVVLGRSVWAEEPSGSPTWWMQASAQEWAREEVTERVNDFCL